MGEEYGEAALACTYSTLYVYSMEYFHEVNQRPWLVRVYSLICFALGILYRVICISKIWYRIHLVDQDSVLCRPQVERERERERTDGGSEADGDMEGIGRFGRRGRLRERF